MQRTLTIAFLSYWHVGNGLGEGARADSIVLKDQHQLPYFPGKTLRGILRNAMEKARALNWYQDTFATTDPVELAFGSAHEGGMIENTEADEPKLTRLTTPGMLFVPNATLSEPEYRFLAQSSQSSLVDALYTTMASTAINMKTGAAMHKSLRAFEVTVPLTLQTILSFNDEIEVEQQSQVFTALSLALPLVEQIGAKRSRGFGRVKLSLEATDAS